MEVGCSKAVLGSQTAAVAAACTAVALTAAVAAAAGDVGGTAAGVVAAVVGGGTEAACTALAPSPRVSEDW